MAKCWRSTPDKGERIANTPLLLMADLQQMICVAEVHEASLKELEIREEDGRLVPARKYTATIKSVALTKALEGEVLEVGRLIGAPEIARPESTGSQRPTYCGGQDRSPGRFE